MIRILLLLVLLAVIASSVIQAGLRLLRTPLGRALATMFLGTPREPTTPRGPMQRAAAELVRCASCGDHVPKPTSVAGAGGYRCQRCASSPD